MKVGENHQPSSFFWKDVTNILGKTFVSLSS